MRLFQVGVCFIEVVDIQKDMFKKLTILRKILDDLDDPLLANMMRSPAKARALKLSEMLATFFRFNGIHTVIEMIIETP